MRLIFLGDVVGRAGRDAVTRELPLLRERYRPDLVVVNGENAAHGFGITEEIFLGFLAAGADAVTLGNHSFDQREALIFIERYPNLLRPVNWPKGCPGRGSALIDTATGKRVLVMQAMGRVMVEPSRAARLPSHTRPTRTRSAGWPGMVRTAAAPGNSRGEPSAPVRFTAKPRPIAKGSVVATSSWP